MQNVAHDGDRDSGQRVGRDLVHTGPQVLQHGAQIEQRLGRMLVHAVAGVQHGQTGGLLEQPRRAAGVVAQNNRLGSQRAQREAGVLQRFALLNAGGKAGDQRRVRTQRLGGQLKAGAGARRRLVEQQRHAPLEENAVALTHVHRFQNGRARQQMADRVQRQVVDGKQRA